VPLLDTLEKGDSEVRLEWLVRQAGEAPLAGLVSRTGWFPAEVLRVGRVLASTNRLLLLGQPPELFAHQDHFRELAKRVVEQLGSSTPKTPGCGAAQGRLALENRRPKLAHPGLPSNVLFNALLQALAAQARLRCRPKLCGSPGGGFN